MDRLTKLQNLGALLLLLGMVLIPAGVFAVSVSLEPAQTSVSPGQSFEVDINIDTGSDCINAAEIAVGFDTAVLQISDFSRGGSILTLWTEFPNDNAIDEANRTGVLRFSGGIPGGFCSHLMRGNGNPRTLAKMEFAAPGIAVSNDAPNVSAIKILDKSRVYLNDGLGTDKTLTASEAQVLFDNASPKNQSAWNLTLRGDKIPPENFSVDIQRDENLFDGKYFVVFFTADKQSGLDYYEVKETPLSNTRPDNNSKWEKTESPYILKDQTLQSVVSIRAIDKAGNVTEANYKPELKKTSGPVIGIGNKFIYISAGILAVLAAVLFLLVRKKLKK